MNWKIITIIIITIIGAIIIYTTLITKSKYQQSFKGLVLFDIDNTLNLQTAEENKRIVQVCLDNNFAVGVCTAGSVYQPDTVMDKFSSWMPENLYEFMKHRKFDTFNNVAPFSGQLLMGKPAEEIYKQVLTSKPINIFESGWLKGFALRENSKHYGIKNKKYMILFDDDKHYIQGVRAYDPDLTVICVGKSCNGTLDIKTVKKAIKSCKLSI